MGLAFFMIAVDKEDHATEQMFAAIGRAITQWSFVEQSLHNIFTVCVTSCPSRPDVNGGFISIIDGQVPSAVFYSIESFRGKLGLVDAALRARVYDNGAWANKIREDWSKLHDKTRKLSGKRNRLAHWTATPAFQDDDKFHEARLMPPFGSPGWWSETGSNPPGDILRTTQVTHLCLAFSLIDEKLRNFYKELAQHPRLCDKYDKLTVRLIRSHDRLNPKRGEQLRLHLASGE